MAPKHCFVVEIDVSLVKIGEVAKTVVLSHQTKWSEWERGG
jgi:hypothetical protein